MPPLKAMSFLSIPATVPLHVQVPAILAAMSVISLGGLASPSAVTVAVIIVRLAKVV